MNNKYNKSEQIFNEFQKVVGDGYVHQDDDTIRHFARSTLPNSTFPLMVIRPLSTDEIQKSVAIAKAYGIYLYPISCGKNWGYGDACAVTDGQVIMDLSRMNRIVEVNLELAYAVIEPGVTQQQLYDYLIERNIPLWFDCTGSGPNASIVGNTLERGFGHTLYGDHFHNSCGMEVVLGDGRVLRTGFGHYNDAKAAYVFKWGIGPYLDGLFTQSNMGIVTRLGIWLMPKPECFNMFFLSMPEDTDLPRMIEALRPLKLNGQIKSLVHIGNDLRIISSFQRYPWQEANGQTPLPDFLRRLLRKKGGFGAWNISGGIYGTSGEVRQLRKEIRKALRPLGRVRFVGSTSLKLAQSISELLGKFDWFKDWKILLGSLVKVGGLLQGCPTDAFLYGTLWRMGGQDDPKTLDPLENNVGLMWLSPIMPMIGSAAQDLVRTISPIFLRYGFDPLITVSLITERSMVAVTTISYDRTNESESKKAYCCYGDLFSQIMRMGYIPYRSSIASMSHLSNGSNVFWDIVNELKQVFDPDDVLAKGRYNPVSLKFKNS